MGYFSIHSKGAWLNGRRHVPEGRAGTSVSSVNMEQAREMTGLDLVLETEPSITNKVKVGAELTFTTTSQSAVFSIVNRIYIWLQCTLER